MNCGRVRTPLNPGTTAVVDGELERLRLSILRADGEAETNRFATDGREIAVVLIRGQADIVLPEEGSEPVYFGPRNDPFTERPSVLLYSAGDDLRVTAKPDSVVAIATSPASRAYATQIIRPDDVREASRGRDNWSRTVRLVCWSDNTEGEQLLVGETLTPSGNWSTIPPHRHATYKEGPDGPMEVPYEEVYFYQFSSPTGFGLCWQFDPDVGLDQAFSLAAGDAVYLDGGYHPVTCGPGADLYQLTLMSGPYRMSAASVHPDFEDLVKDSSGNPYVKQESQNSR
jgi:5-deoxy-glucuronate isomerase